MVLLIISVTCLNIFFLHILELKYSSWRVTFCMVGIYAFPKCPLIQDNFFFIEFLISGSLYEKLLIFFKGGIWVNKKWV